jgi:hypothetical protein
MNLDELCNHLDAWISECLEYDQSEVALNRELAILFYDGKTDVPSREKRSSVVSNDLADALDWIKAGIMRVLFASERLGIYEPESPDSEAMAAAATFAINSIFRKECDGFRVISDAVHNSLLHANGPIKAWWEGQPKYETEMMRGLTQEEYDAVLTDPQTDKVLEVEQYPALPDGTRLDEMEAADNPQEEKTETAGGLY